MSNKETKPEFVIRRKENKAGVNVVLAVLFSFSIASFLFFIGMLIKMFESSSSNDAGSIFATLTTLIFSCLCAAPVFITPKVAVFSTYIRLKSLFGTEDIKLDSVKNVWVYKEPYLIKTVIMADKKYFFICYRCDKKNIDSLIKKLRDKGVVVTVENAILEENVSFRPSEGVSTAEPQPNNGNRNAAPNNARENTGRRRVVANNTLANDDSQDTQETSVRHGRRLEL